MPYRRCPRCGVDKPHAEFHRNRHAKDGCAVYCKPCALTFQRRWREANPEKVAATARKARIKLLYGMTEEDFQARVQAQAGRCPVCREALSEDTNETAIDHDHVTGVVRGVLHRTCNTMLGLARDSAETLRNAALYLETTKEVTSGI